MLGGIHGKGKRYTFCCNTCSTKWSQLKPDLVGPNGDRQLSASSKAIHLTDKRRSNVDTGATYGMEGAGAC